MPPGFAADYRVLRESWGVAELPAGGRLELGGADRERFLNGLVTCEVLGLSEGNGRYGFVTSAQGRILADVVVLAAADRLLLELPAGSEEPIGGHLRKYVVADRVEIEPGPARTTLLVAGPGAEAALAARVEGGLPAEPWDHAEREIAGAKARVLRHPRVGLPAFELDAAPDAAAEIVGALVGEAGDLEAGEAATGRRVGAEALEAVRVEEGIPRFGREFGPENFPQETGLDDAVSYTKGCYLGQEVVARIRYRGQVNRALRGLVFDDGEEPPLEGAAVAFEGREAGRVTSAVRSPRLGRPVALTMIHRRAAEPGTEVEIEGGRGARVVGLPFASAR